MSNATRAVETAPTRELRVEQALFRGANLKLENPVYRSAFRSIIDALVLADLAPSDITFESLGIADSSSTAVILAREEGVLAGLEEAAALFAEHGCEAHPEKRDGEYVKSGETLLRVGGSRSQLLALERVVLNFVQRLSGIATATRRLSDLARAARPTVRVVGTRKTPWGLLDKRALHLGGGGTHRLGLGDAILIKNNHLALLAPREEDAASLAVERAWRRRRDAAFIEVEVRTAPSAIAAAETFRALLDESRDAFPCLILLDNMQPAQIATTVAELDARKLRDSVLLEASGNVDESNIASYAASGVDAISSGALTHSPRALDLSQRIV